MGRFSGKQAVKERRKVGFFAVPLSFFLTEVFAFFFLSQSAFLSADFNLSLRITKLPIEEMSL